MHKDYGIPISNIESLFLRARLHICGFVGILVSECWSTGLLVVIPT
jgi:hypothetical protein